jgi:putative ABC transport system permease protein
MTLRRLLHRLLALGRATRLDHELDAEIAAHLELAERDALAAGLSPREAREHARRQFGAIAPVREAHRDVRSARWLEHVAQDVRYGLTTLARDRSFTIVAVGVLALGIGANAAMFSVVDAVLLSPLPFIHPDRIVRVWDAPKPGIVNDVSVPDFLDWRRMATTFEALAAEQAESIALTGGGDPVRLAARRVTADYFKVFAVGGGLGRTFTERDMDPGAEPVVVISHAAWQAYFGGVADMLQQRPILNGVPHQVIGVLPPGVFDRDDAKLWTPLRFAPDQLQRDWHSLSVTGRLREGVTLAQAREQMRGIDAALTDVTPLWKRDWTPMVERVDQMLVGDTLRRSVLLAFGAVAMVLLIACANVANLLITRGASRAKELAVRSALGATRGRVIAQLLTECFVLCVAGAGAGLLVGSLLVGLATPALGDVLPSTAAVGIDLRVLGFSAAVTAVVTLAIGVLPSVQASAGSLTAALMSTSRAVSGSRARLRGAIVIVEVALSLVLVCGAALMFRSLLNLQRSDPGVRLDHVLTMSIGLSESSYTKPEDVARFYTSLIDRVEATPGVVRGGLATDLPLHWISDGQGLLFPGFEEPVTVRFKRVDPGYFHVLGIQVIAGRGISSDDRQGARGVIVINDVLARHLSERLETGASPIGRTAAVTAAGGRRLPAEIVGVIRNERTDAPGRPDPPVVYMPLAQAPDTDVRMLVRTELDPAAATSSIREVLRQIDSNVPLGDIATLVDVRDRLLTGTSRPAGAIGAFAGMAALLAALGLYGVLAHTVSQRRREIGLRLALGGRPIDVLTNVLRGALALVAIGLVLGLAGAVALTRIMTTLLFDVSPLDPIALALAATSMLAICVAAGFIPAYRAARLNPIAVLREE